MDLPSGAVRENAQILLHRDECLHCQCVVAHLAATLLMIDTHHIAIFVAQRITVHAAFDAALRHNATTKVWPGFHFDLRCVRQAFGCVRRNYKHQAKHTYEINKLISIEVNFYLYAFFRLATLRVSNASSLTHSIKVITNNHKWQMFTNHQWSSTYILWLAK